MEACLANVVARGQVAVFAQARILEDVVKELRHVLSFRGVKCPIAFSTCFEALGWPTTKTLEMLREWTIKQS